MKFTKEDACKHLTSKLSEKGHPLHISERSINEMLDTLMPLLANDETELEDFVNSVLPTFRTANLNIKNDVSVGIKEYKDANPTPPKAVEEPNKVDDANAKLLARIEELEKKNADNERAKTLATRRSDLTAKLGEKGCKDKEWISSFLDEVSLDGDDFDAEARAERYIKMYNKSEAKTPEDDITPKTPKGEKKDSYVNSVIAAAAAKNKEASALD